MNRVTFATMLFSALIGTSVANAGEHASHAHNAHQMNQTESVMDYMHRNMAATPHVASKNLDYNFIANMIPHHQDAIDSSEYLLKHSQDPIVMAIAEEIISVQRAEIADFKVLLPILEKEKPHWSPDEIAAFNREAQNQMEKMHHDMAGVKLSGNVEKDFLSGMVAHHVGAVEASKQILKHTKNDKIIEIAHNIIKAQDAEIEMFNKLIAQMK